MNVTQRNDADAFEDLLMHHAHIFICHLWYANYYQLYVNHLLIAVRNLYKKKNELMKEKQLENNKDWWRKKIFIVVKKIKQILIRNSIYKLKCFGKIVSIQLWKKFWYYHHILIDRLKCYEVQWIKVMREEEFGRGVWGGGEVYAKFRYQFRTTIANIKPHPFAETRKSTLKRWMIRERKGGVKWFVNETTIIFDVASKREKHKRRIGVPFVRQRIVSALRGHVALLLWIFKWPYDAKRVLRILLIPNTKRNTANSRHQLVIQQMGIKHSL